MFRIVERNGADWKNYRMFQSEDGVNIWRPSPILMKKDSGSYLQCYDPASLVERIARDDSISNKPSQIDFQYLMSSRLTNKTAIINIDKNATENLVGGTNAKWGCTAGYGCISPVGGSGDVLFNRDKPMLPSGVDVPRSQIGYVRITESAEHMIEGTVDYNMSHYYLDNEVSNPVLVAGKRRYCLSFAMAVCCERLKVMLPYTSLDVVVPYVNFEYGTITTGISMRRILGIDSLRPWMTLYKKSTQQSQSEFECDVWGNNVAAQSVSLIRGSLYIDEKHPCAYNDWKAGFMVPWITFPLSSLQFPTGSTGGTITINYCEVLEAWVPTANG